MTTYTSISNALVAVGAKPFATTIQALRDNPIAIAEGDASVPAALFPTVLLGTINTTSGSTQTLSGLTLTPYKAVLLSFNAVSFSATAANLRINGQVCSTNNAATADSYYGLFWIALDTGAAQGAVAIIASNPGSASLGTTYVLRTDYTTASTSISVSTNSNFDAGSVAVYGVK